MDGRPGYPVSTLILPTDMKVNSPETDLTPSSPDSEIDKQKEKESDQERDENEV